MGKLTPLAHAVRFAIKCGITDPKALADELECTLSAVYRALKQLERADRAVNETDRAVKSDRTELTVRSKSDRTVNETDRAVTPSRAPSYIGENNNKITISSSDAEVDDEIDGFRLEKLLREAAGASIAQSEFVPGLMDLCEIRALIGEKFDLENQILPTVRDIAARHRGAPISAWKYFATAVRRRCRPGGEPVAVTPKEKTLALIAKGVHPLTAARQTGLVIG